MGPEDSKRWKVLLVDDEPDHLKLVAALIESHGFSVLTAGGPREAIAIVSNRLEQINGSSAPHRRRNAAISRRTRSTPRASRAS